MKILMLGSGGREHALIKKLKESEKVSQIFCAPGNGGISMDAQCVPIGVLEGEKLLDFALKNSIDLVFVAPDDPLAAGMVDLFESNGIRAFGPNQKAARIESSKVFSKNLMKKYNIPTASYEVFESAFEAIKYIEKNNSYPTVIKADGLALGKGVIIAEDLASAKKAVKEIMEDKVFGKSGNKIVVEEFISGPEVSVLAFTDGKTVKPMVSSTDHKRAYDGNKGPNTGGMGTISPNPHYNKKTAEYCFENIFIPTIKAMQAEACPFKGCLYFGLMLTKDGPKVIEYNARFGDPEAQVVLPRLKTPLIDILDAVIDERLDEISIQWDEDACACVILASGGYPGSYKKGLPIVGLNEKGGLEGAEIFHSGTVYNDGKFYSSGGRVLGVCAKGSALDEALNKAYDSIKKIKLQDGFYRTDIGRT
ncbi:MAG TPA: phosphoribosylamine--glycine ligase [Clostridiales bacterium]|nr:phosphoribosylamine--glycine ligase [Clostridiales bacterium]